MMCAGALISRAFADGIPDVSSGADRLPFTMPEGSPGPKVVQKSFVIVSLSHLEVSWQSNPPHCRTAKSVSLK